MNFLDAVSVLDYLPKLKTSPGLAFGAHFLHEFGIKMFLSYSINEQSFNVIPSFFHNISNKMYYSVLI